MRGTTAIGLLSLSICTLLATPSAAVELYEKDRFIESTPTTADEFGFSVALRNGELLIAARSDGAGSLQPGWVRTWIPQGFLWSRFDRFAASDGGATKRFGETLAASGNYAIAGSSRNNDFGQYSGSAYIFLRGSTGWSQQAKLLPSDPAAFDEFGIGVAIDGNEAMVGARSDDDGGSQSGSVYVFRRNGTAWPQQQKLVAADDATKDFFGSAIDIDGSYAIIGAPGDDTNTGSAYIFLKTGSTWAQQAKLTANDRAGGDIFGTSVAIVGSIAAVGAPGDNSSTGAVYIYQRSGTNWSQTGKITLVGGVASNAFGDAIAMFNDQLLVGAPGVNSARGEGFLLERSGSTWVLLANYVASDGATADRLGDSVALDADHVLLGAPHDAGGAGSAYLFDAIALDCNGNGISDVCDTSCIPFDPVTGLQCATPGNCGLYSDCNLNTIPDDCETDCDTNGIADECDIASGAPDCNTNGIPDTCETDCNNNGIADECDITSGFSSDCNANNVPDECELIDDESLVSVDFETGALPTGWSATGLWHVTDQCVSGVPCDGANWAYFGVDGDCDFDTGAIVTGALTSPAVYVPFAANRAKLRYCSNYDGDRGPAPNGFDAAWVTVNGEIVDDVGATVTTAFWETREVDLAAYAGQTITIAWHFDSNDALLNNRLGWQVDHIEFIVDSDCDNNGALDECEIAESLAEDCNANGVPDTCDLALGDSSDCNSNAMPDECESSEDCDTNGITDICETAIIHVDAVATGANNGTSWADAYTDLQAALTRADELCVEVEVWVAAGTYTPAASGGSRSASFALRDRVAIYGGFTGTEFSIDQRNPNPVTNGTVLSGDLDGGGASGNSYHVVTAGLVDASAVLDGFTIQDGVANGTSPNNAGGAISLTSASPTIANCLITGHTGVAGAILVSGGSPSFDTCAIVNNSAELGGGGYIQGAATPTFTACRFLGNVASTDEGGALFITATSKPKFENCLFSGNATADSGGAIHAQLSSAPVFTNCTFTNNYANLNGGGAYAAFNAKITAINCIFWSNFDLGGSDESAQLAASNSTLTVRYSCIQGLTGGLGGIGNIASNPNFADAIGADSVPGTLDDDVSLAPLSPCIDAGSNGVVTTATDLNGLKRRVDDLFTTDTGFGTAPIVDIGAVEFQSDCNTNGIADSVDISSANSSDCNANFVPDECEISATSGAPGGPFHCTVDCDPDCNNNGVPDECDIAGGTSEDCAGEGVPDECELDCNNNNVSDSCDIHGGTSGDCNANAIPDDCELAEGDCDENGKVDACELAQPYVTVISGRLEPVQGSVILSYSIPNAREAIGNVTLTFQARADLSGNSEYIEVRINGTVVGEVFRTGATDCPTIANQAQLVLTPAEYNALLNGGDAVIELEPTDGVDVILGCDSYVLATIQYLAFQDCNQNGIPDACEPDCNGNGIADGCDITSGFSVDCNGNGSPDDCDIAEGTSLDVNGSNIPDDCELDCDMNGVPDECDTSCTNLVLATGNACAAAFPTECGLATDCDNNNVPDQCDPDCDADNIVDSCAIAAGSAPDCNANNIPDECDITEGPSVDCDANAIPDECETDTDTDGFIDACDGCPNDSAKTAPGACGCGHLDTDSDADGVANCNDDCPGTAPSTPVDENGCPFQGACCFGLGACDDGPGLDQETCEQPPPIGFGGVYQGNGSTCASDRDGDLVANCDDGCPDDPDKFEPGDCGCGLPDVDLDGDGVPSCLDLCPNTAAGKPVDANGCHLYGACCSATGVCVEGTFSTQAFCDGQQKVYQGNGSTCALNCEPRQLGDYDADGDVDLDDFAAFTDCAGRPVEAAAYLPPSALCQLVFDIDADGDVDLYDYHAIQSMMAE